MAAPQQDHIASEVVITATKRKADPQKLPTSLSVFDEAEIENAGIADMLDVVPRVPNLHIKHAAAENTLVIRGISGFDTSIGSAAALYVDDVCFPLNYMHNPDLFEIQEITVLRGPQGTLYGRNSESGVVHIVTKAPGNTDEGYFSISPFLHDVDGEARTGVRLGGSYSGPIVEDRLFIGFSGSQETSQGFIENTLTKEEAAGETDHENGRFRLRWKGSRQFTADFIGDIALADDGNANKRYVSGPFTTPPYEVRYDNDTGRIRQHGHGETLKLHYDASNWQIVSVTGARYYQNHMTRDADCGPFPMGMNNLDYRTQLYSQEVRVTSADRKDGTGWLFGLYGFDEDTETDILLEALGEHRISDINTRGMALFGEGTWSLVPGLRFTLGIRGDHVDLEGDQNMTAKAGNKRFDGDRTDTEYLPKASIAWDVHPRLMGYATIARGYLSGGFNTAFANSDASFTYKPEYTTNYEIGCKGRAFAGRMTTSLALFWIDIKDKQVSELVPDGKTDVRTIRNAAEAHSTGVELSMDFQATPLLSLHGSYGFTQAEFDDWTTTETTPSGKTMVVDYEGRELPNAPTHTYNIGFHYQRPDGFFGRMDLLGTGEYYSDVKNIEKLDSYQTVDARIGYVGERIETTLWARNLFDEEYETVRFARRQTSAIDGAPRSFGVTFTLRF